MVWAILLTCLHVFIVLKCLAAVSTKESQYVTCGNKGCEFNTKVVQTVLLRPPPLLSYFYLLQRNILSQITHFLYVSPTAVAVLL